MFRQTPGFTIAAVPALTLGIGANTAIFSVVQSVLLQPLPFPEPDRLVVLWEDHRGRGGPATEWTNPATLQDWKAQPTLFDGVAGFLGSAVNLTGDEEPERLRT